MTEIGHDDAGDRAERAGAAGGARRNAWVRTLDDMEALADERRENGWDVLSIPAGSTAAVSRDSGDDPDRFGLVYVIADNHAAEFSDAVEGGEFPRYEAYRSEVEGHVCLVTELLDPATETAILLAGQYDLRQAAGMVTSARDEGVLYTHVRTIDGTHLGSFRHEEFAPLVPNADTMETWTAGRRSSDDEE